MNEWQCTWTPTSIRDNEPILFKNKNEWQMTNNPVLSFCLVHVLDLSEFAPNLEHKSTQVANIEILREPLLRSNYPLQSRMLCCSYNYPKSMPLSYSCRRRNSHTEETSKIFQLKASHQLSRNLSMSPHWPPQSLL